MDAIEFVKKFGLDKARGIIAVMSDGVINYDGESVNYSELKQIVNSFDLVEGKGGVEISKEILETWAFMLAVKAKVGRLADLLAEDYDALKQAVELVEECNES